jgi:hypothetical protein
MACGYVAYIDEAGDDGLYSPMRPDAPQVLRNGSSCRQSLRDDLALGLGVHWALAQPMSAARLNRPSLSDPAMSQKCQGTKPLAR